MGALGVSLIEGVHQHHPGWGGVPGVLAALDAFTASAAKPSHFAIWYRIGLDGPGEPGKGREAAPDCALLDGLATRGIIPVVFWESTGWTYPDILAGVHDARIDLLARRLAGYDAIVRIDQEMNGDGLKADWQTPEARERYAPMFGHVKGILGARVRTLYCPMLRLRKHIGDFERFYPGAAADVVGFDAYSRDEAGRSIPDQWGWGLAELARIAPGVPIIIPEFARLDTLLRRAAWLRTIKDVLPLIEAALYFNIRLWTGHTWPMNRSMLAAYAAIQAGAAAA